MRSDTRHGPCRRYSLSISLCPLEVSMSGRAFGHGSIRIRHFPTAIPYVQRAPGTLKPLVPGSSPAGLQGCRAVTSATAALWRRSGLRPSITNHPWRASDDPAGWPVLAPSSASSRLSSPPRPCAWPSHEHAHARARTLTRISGKTSRSSRGCCCSTPPAPATVTALTGCAAGPRPVMMFATSLHPAV